VPPDWTAAGAGPADIAAKHQKINQHPDIGRAMGLLREAHAVHANDTLGVHIDLRGAPAPVISGKG
jgi:hypothetical protein